MDMIIKDDLGKFIINITLFRLSDCFIWLAKWLSPRKFRIAVSCLDDSLPGPENDILWIFGT